MNKIYIKARAKVNLNLEIIEKRKDNYHNIQSIFQKINLYDELFIQKTKADGIELYTNIAKLQSKENIIVKAYEILKQKDKKITGVRVNLIKRIPTQAGLGGGSSDAASFVLAMNKLFNLKLTKTEIEKIGKELGADVVACLYNKAVQVDGIGEIITPVNTSFKYYFVIVKPKISYSTKEMYQKIDNQEMSYNQERTKNIKQALEQQNINQLIQNLYNRFEEAVPDNDIIQGIKNELIQQGALRKFNDWIRIVHIWNIYK